MRKIGDGFDLVGLEIPTEVKPIEIVIIPALSLYIYMNYSTYRLRKCGEKWQTSEGTELILALSIRISSKEPVPFKDGK